jgi:hypothetical protein
MKNSITKVIIRLVTGLMTITVLGACGPDTNDFSLHDDKNEKAKFDMGSRTNSIPNQTRNVSYTEKKANRGHHYGHIKQFDRKALEVVRDFATELGFNAIFTLDNDGIIMDMTVKDIGNWHPEEMVQKIMELYGMEKRPDITEVAEGQNIFLIYTKVALQQEIQAKINELGLGDSIASKRYRINEINVFSHRWTEVNNYQVKMDELFKYIEGKVGKQITIDLWHSDSFNKYYSVKW